MPELPDIATYVDALAERIVGALLETVALKSPFLLRSAQPPLGDVAGKQVVGVSHLSKRIVMSFEGDLHLVLHLMVAGRLRWNAGTGGRIALAVFEFSTGSLLLTEASKKKRASLHVVKGNEALAAHDRGGLDPMTISFEDFVDVLRRERHTLKRTLTDPRLLSGIGNAYSDEILHRARLGPVTMSDRLDDEAAARLHAAMQEVLAAWIERLGDERAGGFPDKVTAFRDEMAVHGRFGKPCPSCGTSVQRIRHADSEVNYCPRCQTGGKLLADRSLSRLLKSDWPRTIDELERVRLASSGRE